MQNSPFLSTLILLILVTDPLGSFPFYVSLLRNVAPERKFRVIAREVGVAFLVLLVFMLCGGGILRFLQLTETSLGIAGGVVLFLIALRMIFPHRGEGIMGEDEDQHEPFIVPLAIPLIAGPSALATVLLLAARAPQALPELIAALSCALAFCALTLLFAERISHWLGPQVTKAFERLMGLVLSAIAVEMLLSGIRHFVQELI